MKTNHIEKLIAVSFSLLLVCVAAGHAADSYWTNSVAGDFTNAANWTPGVPAGADTANFTNSVGILGLTYTVNWSASVTNANAQFTGSGTTVTQAIGSAAWWVTNQYVVSGLNNTSSVVHASGTLLVTNATGTGQLMIGQSGKGQFTMQAGSTVIADQLFSTNGKFNFAAGTLTTLNGSTINEGATVFNIGSPAAGQVATWNILGGTNLISASLRTVFGNGNGASRVTVSGPSTVWTNTGYLYIGYNGLQNQLIITNGAKVFSAGSIGAIIGQSSTGLVTGANSLWNMTGGSGDLRLGGPSNSLTIADGGRINSTIGLIAGSVSNQVLVTGSGSIWSNTGAIYMGTNGTGNGLTISQSGGVFAASIRVGGAISTGSTVRIDSGGTLNADTLVMTNGVNSSFSASGGSLTVKAATIGSFFSLTNGTAIISSNLTVTGSGSLSGTNGAFVLYGDFVNQSTNRAQFDLSRSAVFFTNGAGVSIHTLNLTNSAAFDLGGGSSVAQFATNFAIGTLSIALSNQVTLTGAKSGGTTNALYVGGLDLSAWDTSAAGLTNTLMAALSLTNINLYYDPNVAGNAYLGDQTYNLWGGGLVIPIPEPSTAGLILGGALFSAWLLRRRVPIGK